MAGYNTPAYVACQSEAGCGGCEGVWCGTAAETPPPPPSTPPTSAPTSTTPTTAAPTTSTPGPVTSSAPPDTRCTDSDTCLQQKPDWSISYTCNTSDFYCDGAWADDMHDCCPETCDVVPTTCPPSTPAPTPAPTGSGDDGVSPTPAPTGSSDDGAACPRPTGWCTHSGSTYKEQDCDGDGIADPTCSDWSGRFGVQMSASDCSDSWPEGQCVSNDDVSPTPAPTPASATQCTAEDWTVWRCPISQKVITCDWVCDDWDPPDCDDGEDEDPELCATWVSYSTSTPWTTSQPSTGGGASSAWIWRMQN